MSVAWFSGTRPGSEPAAAAARHHSEALRAVVDSLRPDAHPTVLDLGPSLAGNLRFLSGLSCRVRIADLHRALCEESLESRRPEAMAALLERLLPLGSDEQFDALLAWDVFDYLRPDQVATLMAHLTPACRPQALALVLLSTGHQIPARPRRYRIVDRQTLGYDATPQAQQRPCPRHSLGDLGRLLPGFSVRRSQLLRNGMLECQLVRGSVDGTREREAQPAPLSGRAWFRRGRV